MNKSFFFRLFIGVLCTMPVISAYTGNSTNPNYIPPHVTMPSITTPPSLAAKSAKLQDLMARRRPTESLALAKELLEDAITQRHMPTAMDALNGIEWALRSLSGENRIAEFYDAANLLEGRLDQFSSHDQGLYRLKLIDIYLDAYRRNYYRYNSNRDTQSKVTGEQADPSRPDLWGADQYEERIYTLLQSVCTTLEKENLFANRKETEMIPFIGYDIGYFLGNGTATQNYLPTYPPIVTLFRHLRVDMLQRISQDSHKERIQALLHHALEKQQARDPQKKTLYSWLRDMLEAMQQKQSHSQIAMRYLPLIKQEAIHEWHYPIVEFVTARLLDLEDRIPDGYNQALMLIESFQTEHPQYSAANTPLGRRKEQIKSGSITQFASQGTAILPMQEEAMTYQMQYRNLSQVQVSVYPILFEVTPNHQQADRELCQSVRERLAKKPVWEKTLTLQTNIPYAIGKESLTLPGLPQGNYAVIFSPLPLYTSVNRDLRTVSHLVVTDRFPVNLQDYPEQNKSMQILDAYTGAPIANASFTAIRKDWKRGGNFSVYSSLHKTQSDQWGAVALSRDADAIRQDAPEHNALLPASGGNYNYNRNNSVNLNQVSNEFLIQVDRPLYRPGATIDFAVVAYQRGMQMHQARVRPQVEVEVRLFNPEHEEIAKQNLKTDAQGMASGRITLPKHMLLGTYSMQVTETRASSYNSHYNIGYTYIEVAEYKRPSFEIKLEEQKEAAKLNQEYRLKGNAKALSGAALQGAKVSYTLEGMFGRWSYRFYNPSSSSKQVLAQGEVPIDSNSGDFEITALLPDLKPQALKEEGENLRFSFHKYTFSVVVTAPSGETTQEQLSIFVGTPHTSCQYEGPKVLFKDRKDLLTPITLTCTTEGGNYTGKLWYELRTQSGKTIENSSQEANKDFPVPATWLRLPSGTYELYIKNPTTEEWETESTEIVICKTTDNKSPSNKIFWATPIQTDYDNNDSPRILWSSTEALRPIFVAVRGVKGLYHFDLIKPRKAGSLYIFSVPLPHIDNYEEQKVAVTLYTVHRGVLYQETYTFQRRQPNKELSLKWNTFRDRTRVGSQERWSIALTQPNGKPAAHVRLKTWMYDASLDLITQGTPYRQSFRKLIPEGVYGMPPIAMLSFADKNSPLGYPSHSQGFLDHALLEEVAVRGYHDPRKSHNESMLYGAVMEEESLTNAVASTAMAKEGPEKAEAENQKEAIDTSAVELRSNFAETAFFYTQIETNEKGEASWEATLPQSLTRWNLLIHAYDNQLNDVWDSKTIEAYKEFTIEPMMPRFVRHGDQALMGATLRNLTTDPLQAIAQLEIFDPTNDSTLYSQQVDINLAANEAKPLLFKYNPIPQYLQVGVRWVAMAEGHSDGEQHLLPQVASGKIITQAQPIFAAGTSKWEFTPQPLFSGEERDEKSSITVDVLANPALLAIQSLPFISEPETPNTVEYMAAAYSRAVGNYLLTQPAVKEWLKEQRAAMPQVANNSPLRLREELKQQPLSETPWTHIAKQEEERTAAVVAFMENPNKDVRHLLEEAIKLQDHSGHWYWYAGMSPAPALTPVMIEHLGSIAKYLDKDDLELVEKMLSKAWKGYVNELNKRKEWLRQQKESYDHMAIEAMEMIFLWHHSRNAAPSSGEQKAMYDFCLTLLTKNAEQFPISALPMAGVALYKAGKEPLARTLGEILESHLTHDATQGAFFDNLGTPYYYWYNPNMRMQLFATELFALLKDKNPLTYAMKQWVLGQKRTTHWHSSLSTLWAIETLLTPTGDQFNPLSHDKITLRLSMQHGGIQTHTGSHVAASLPAQDLNLSRPIVIEHQEPQSPIWGGVYATFYQPYDRMQEFGKELKVQREIRVKRIEGDREVLLPLEGTTLQVGDYLVTTLYLYADRAMDFVSIIDTRAGCCEPAQQLSGYQYSSYPGYYLEVRDQETRFYFHHIARGSSSVSYEQKVVRPGVYSAGVATMQSAYAPEFTAHTRGTAPLSISRK